MDGGQQVGWMETGRQSCRTGWREGEDLELKEVKREVHRGLDRGRKEGWKKQLGK